MSDIKFKYGMDTNGNSIIKVSRKGYRGFSVQTNGNLPQTHYMRTHEVNTHIIHDELLAYCGIYGTANQVKVLSI
jgi:hypothetical protein